MTESTFQFQIVRKSAAEEREERAVLNNSSNVFFFAFVFSKVRKRIVQISEDQEQFLVLLSQSGSTNSGLFLCIFA